MDFLHRLFIRKETHKYAIELLKEVKKMPVDVAESLPRLKKSDPVIKNASSKIELINYLIRNR